MVCSSKVEFSLLQGRYSREEIKKWKEVFAAAPRRLTQYLGRINVDELIKTAKSQGVEMDDEEAAEFIKDFDNNNNGTIEFSGE
ncbi:unnamed protein product [Penicillium bialowiezense]